MRLRLVLPGQGRGRGLGGLRRLLGGRRAAAGFALGLGWVLAAVLAVVLIGRSDDPDPGAVPQRAERTPAPASAEPPPAEPGDTQVQETDGSLAIGLTEPNPNFLFPPAVRPAGEPFGRWQSAVDRLRPDFYRLVLDWPSLQPSAATPASFDVPNGGCLRDVQPCAPWAGVRDQLRAAAARQKATGMKVLVVISGTPEWAARPASGCERAGIEPRSRTPRADALPAYQALVAGTLTAAAQAGVELRYWSAWNEPNHPYFISPQRPRCSASARSAAVARYVELARALDGALKNAPGDQEYVLGELAGLLNRKPRNTGVEEFARALPDDLVCGAKAWAQHGYVGGPDPVDAAVAGIASHGCARAPEIWITETGVGGPKRGQARERGDDAQREACEAMRRRLRRWYEDPRVTAAFQYTLREDDRFPTGLVNTSLTRGYPVLREWQAWGRRPGPESAVPRSGCA